MTEACTRVRGGKSRTRAAQLKSVSLKECLKDEPLKAGQRSSGVHVSRACLAQPGVPPRLTCPHVLPRCAAKLYPDCSRLAVAFGPHSPNITPSGLSGPATMTMGANIVAGQSLKSWRRQSMTRLKKRAAKSSPMNMRQAGRRLRRQGYATAFRLDRGVHPFARHFDELLHDGRAIGKRRKANALAGIAFKFLRWRQ